MAEKPAEGLRFSHLYVSRGEAKSDSQRVRHRIRKYLADLEYSDLDNLAAKLEQELGVEFDYKLDFSQCSLRDLLDAITIIFKELTPHLAREFLEFARRALREENMAYRIDDRGGVHYLVDEEFTHNLTATISGLQETRFNAAQAAVERIQPSLDTGDTRAAVRAAFDAVENVFKVMLAKKASRLGSAEINSVLTPHVEGLFDGAAKQANNLLLKSFGQWVAAAHQYRHVEGVPDAPPPPMSLTVLLVSNGAAYVRWLISLEAATTSQSVSIN